MKQTITKNDKSLKILNKLITNGYYKGYVEPEKFELKRKKDLFNSGGNHRIIGILNEQKKYELKFDFDCLMSINTKILLILGIIFSIIALIKGNWVMPIIFVVFGFTTLTYFKLKGKKEMELFTSKFLEFHKNEYD